MPNNLGQLSIISFLLPLCLSLVFTWGARKLSLRLGWVAAPIAGRWHRLPTPTQGGIAIFLSFLLSGLGLGLIADERTALLISVAAGVFLLGLTDDFCNLRPQWKLLFQVLCSLIFLLFGLRLHLTGIEGLDILLTILWLVGITNAFNLLDNMNGLCAGIAILVAGFRAALFIVESEPYGALLCFAFMGATLGFLFYNFPTARIFMGNAGSLFIGFWLAGITLVGPRPYTRSYVGFLFFPVLVMLVPIFDTALVTLTRKLAGRAISQGGKDHASHRLVAYGLSERDAVLVLWSLSFVAGSIALTTTVYGISRLVPILALLLTGLVVFGAYLSRFEVGSRIHKGWTEKHRAVLRTIGVGFAVLLDLILIIVSYYTAFMLKFEGELNAETEQLFLHSLAGLILIKLGVLLTSGIYRSWWRHFGIEDAIRVGRAAAIASAGAVVYFFFIYRLEGFPRTVILLDFILFCFLMLVFRLSFRILDRWAPLSEGTGRRVLIYPADDMGEFALRLILGQRTFNPVGFLSNDGGSRGYRIHSVPVRGSAMELEQIVNQCRVDGLILASEPEGDTVKYLSDACERLGLTVYRAYLDIRKVEKV